MSTSLPAVIPNAHVQRDLAIGQPNTQTRDTNDSAIRQLWNDLKAHPPAGGINFRGHMLAIERESNPRLPYTELFNRLIVQIALDYEIEFPAIATLSLQQFSNMQQQLFDNSLTKVWEKIKETHQDLPNFALAAEIRAFLNDPANALQLGRIAALDLGSLTLHVVPPEIYRLAQLQTLYLGSNLLRVIPGLSALTHLQKLDLRDNLLKTIPGLNELTGLQELNLNDNILEAIPDLSALTHLQKLDLSDNLLRTIPGLSRLAQLQELNLSKNYLTAIPGLSALTQLQKLNLSDNLLTATPDLSRLTQLEELQLNNNQLTEAPGLSASTHLETLNLSNNHLLRAPDLSALTGLRMTDLSNNPFSTTPPDSELNRNNPPVESSSAVRPEGFIQRFVRGIDLLFTKLRRYLTECFQFLKGLIFRT